MSLNARRRSALVLAVALILAPVTASAAPVGGFAGLTLDAASLWSWVSAKVQALFVGGGEVVEAPVEVRRTQKTGSQFIDLG